MLSQSSHIQNTWERIDRMGAVAEIEPAYNPSTVKSEFFSRHYNTVNDGAASSRATLAITPDSSSNAAFNFRPESLPFAFSTQSYFLLKTPREQSLRRKDSLRSRFARFRSTASPNALRDAVTPSLWQLPPFGSTNTLINEHSYRLPLR